MRRMNMSRVAAATGIAFVGIGVALTILGEVKDFNTAGDFAVRASNEMWGSYTLLVGVAAILLFWFTATAATRMRQLEHAYGGSGRLASTFFGAGTAIAGLLALEVAVQWTVRSGGGVVFAGFGTSILEGPTILFPAAALVAAAGLIGLRSAGLPTYSQFLAQISLPLSAAFVAGAGLQIFKNYAWINDTAAIAFFAWVLYLSIIGVVRWTNLDAGTVTAPRAAPAPAAPAATAAPAAAPARKPRAKKPAARKPRA